MTTNLAASKRYRRNHQGNQLYPFHTAYTSPKGKENHLLKICGKIPTAETKTRTDTDNIGRKPPGNWYWMHCTHHIHNNQKYTTEQNNFHTRRPFHEYGHWALIFWDTIWVSKKLPIHPHPHQFDPTGSNLRVKFNGHSTQRLPLHCVPQSHWCTGQSKCFCQ